MDSKEFEIGWICPYCQMYLKNTEEYKKHLENIHNYKGLS